MDEKETFHFVERFYCTFRRSLRLPPPGGDPEQMQAGSENGVLTAPLPQARTAGALAPHPGAGPAGREPGTRSVQGKPQARLVSLGRRRWERLRPRAMVHLREERGLGERLPGLRPEEDHLPSFRIGARQADLAAFQEIESDRPILMQEQGLARLEGASEGSFEQGKRNSVWKIHEVMIAPGRRRGRGAAGA